MVSAIYVLINMVMSDMNYDRFTSKADLYDKFRPKYSGEFIDYIYKYLGISDNTVVADIGAGTGILSEEFLKRGSSVICVEPNKKMLEQAKYKLQQFEKVSFINTTAENTSIINSSVNIVTVGQAFHWFDKKDFLKECRRILIENGFVVLAWNISDSNDPVNKEITNTNYMYCKKYNGYSSRDKEDNTEYLDFFTNNKMEINIFENNLLLDKEGFIGRCLSRSYAPNFADEEYQYYVDSMLKIFDTYSENKKIRIKNNTKCIIGKVK